MKSKLVISILFCLLCVRGFAAITGTLTVCENLTTTLTESTHPGGTWAPSDASIATVGSTTGIVTGVLAGTTVITYRWAPGAFYFTATVTVNTAPTAITGTLAVCEGASSTLSSTPSGGTWYPYSTGPARVGNTTGILTGYSAGTQGITYALSDGCKATAIATANANPAVISTPSAFHSVCMGYQITYSCTTTGGTWSSSNSNATIVGSTGVITGVTAGSSIITYTNSAGCYQIQTVFVWTNPDPITGPDQVCVGSTINLSDDAPVIVGWTSSNSAVASTPGGGTTATITGVSSGTALITFTKDVYIYGGGYNCYITKQITVGAGPITGNLSICQGATSTLSGTPGGGTWSSTNTGVATIGSTSGIVTGVSPGTSTISYNGGTGCVGTTVVTINALPAAITGTLTVCVGLTTTLSDATGGGTWSSSNTDIATVDVSSGVVTGVAGGTATISYILGTGCYTTTVVSVNTSPAAITGTATICINSTTTLSDATGGGTWSSSNTGVATVGISSGIVTGVSAGTATITYAIGSGCYATITVTVGSTTKPSVQCIQDEITEELGFQNVGNLSSITVEFTANITDGSSPITAATSPLVLNTGSAYEFTQVTISNVIDDSYAGFPTGWSVVGFDLHYINYNGCRWPTNSCRAGARHGAHPISPVNDGVLSIKPNPNTGTFTLDGVVINSNTATNATVEVFDLLGNIIYSETAAVENGAISSSITIGDNIANGLYFVKVSCQDIRQVIKLTLQR